MTHDKEILLQQIKMYFLVAYSHQLADEEASSLANILFSGGVTPELVSFAVSDRGGPHPNPDDNFVPEKIFQLWHVLHPITVSSKKNHLLNVFCKGILYSYLLNISENNALILSTVFQKNSKADLGYTRFLYSSFLGHSEFEMARSYTEMDPQLADRYYRSCIEHLMVARKLDRGKENFLHNCGMVGVSHYYVAQFLSGVEKQRHLSLSIENLESAERLGDKKTDHFKFLGEALLQYASETNDLSGYIRARDKLKQAYNQDPSFTSAIDSLSECELKIGISKVLGGQSSAEAHLKESIRLCDLFETLESPMGRSKAVIQGRPGKARLYLWYHSKKDSELLDQAIEDLQAANDVDPPYWSYSLTNALFERYLLFEDISDFQEAKKLNDQNHSADNRNESHLKQRGRIYLTWAKNFADEEAYDIALKSFRICLPSEDPKIQSYIGLLLASRGMQFGYENDLREAIKWLETKPDLSDRAETKIGILPKVYRVLAMKIHQKQLEEALSLLDRAIAILQGKLSDSEPSSNQELAEYHDLIGSTYHDRYKLSNLPEDIYYAIEHLQQAYDLGMADTMFFGRLGYVCLQRGIITDEPENQSGFFEDAIKYLELSRNGGNEDASNYSELGEAYLRLYRIRKDRRILKKALDMFLESLNRGNDTVENLGLIGDCYYHLSYFEISEANLFKALEFKAKAREAGHESKEHFSVVGRINLSLFEKLGNQDYFITGIKFICEAGLKDKTWPWPVCQLAEVAEQSPDLIQQLKSKGQIGESFSYPDEGIWRFFLDNQSEELWFEAAKLAANWPEVKEKILGGKSKVYIVDDPHGLISTTYVFKPGDNPKKPLPDRGLLRLREEQERTLKMNQYLVQIGAEKFLVPTPIRIFSMDDAEIYAMRRATGRNLSNLILYGPDRYCEEAIRNTIEFLALYHAWHPVPQENKEQVVEESRNRLNNLKQVIEAVGLPIGDKIINVTEPIFEIMKQLPLVEKRDAHPDNWIVTNEGKIVMIDLEKPEPLSQFILSELVQVVEDLPYLPWDREGWQRRKALITNYLEYYNRFLELKSIPQVSISSEQQVAGYLSFTTWRALCGIGFAFGEEHREGISSSTKLRWKDQMEHYFNLVSVVPAIWSEENISFAALNWDPLLTSVEEIRKAVYSLKRDD